MQGRARADCLDVAAGDGYHERMSAENEVLIRATFRKDCSQDVRLCVWRQGCESLFSDIEEDGRTRTESWPASQTSAVRLLKFYEQQLRSKGLELRQPLDYVADSLSPNATIL